MKILMNFPQVNKAVVQGSTGQYVVDYAAMTCTCPDHIHRHRRCKHIGFVVDQLFPGLDGSPVIECDDCHVVKPESEFRNPGHLSGGRAFGYDIESNVCAACAKKSYEDFQRELGEAAVAEMAAEDQSAGISAAPDNREYIAPLVVGNRWAYWVEQLQPDGSTRGFPLEFPCGVRAWRTDQTYIGDEQMTGMVSDVEGRTASTFRSSIVRVSTPTRDQYDAWMAARGELVSARQ